MIQEIKEKIIESLPEKVKLAKVEFEGPEIVIYTKNPEIIKDNGSLIRDLAKDIRKRIIIRSDKSVLLEPNETITKIEEIVPVEAEITDISFDEVTNEVIIESKKPGLVIGKYGTTSREIVKQTGWAPKILRTPPVSSETVQKIRLTLKRNSKERTKFLQDLGKRIHREARFDNDWVRLTSLGGFREVGRSCLFLQTPNSKVILDCGVNVAGVDEKTAYPYLNVPEFNLSTLDAVIVTHAHLDHTGFVPYLYHTNKRHDDTTTARPHRHITQRRQPTAIQHKRRKRKYQKNNNTRLRRSNRHITRYKTHITQRRTHRRFRNGTPTHR